jgi:hypothetical protein
MNNYTWEDVKEFYNEYACALTNAHVPKTVPASHVFDENMSVKWNKEEVERYNTEVLKAREEAYEKKSRAWIETTTAAISAIKADFKDANTVISETGAKRLWDNLSSLFEDDIDAIEDMVCMFTSALSEYDV